MTTTAVLLALLAALMGLVVVLGYRAYRKAGAYQERLKRHEANAEASKERKKADADAARLPDDDLADRLRKWQRK